MSLPKLGFATKAESNAIVLGWTIQVDIKEKAEKSDKKKGPAPIVYGGTKNKDVESLTEKLQKSKHFFAKKNEVSLLRFYPYQGYESVILLGFGPQKNWTTEGFRQTGAALSLLQRREKLPSVTVDAESVFANVKSEQIADYVTAFCEGYLMAGYEFEGIRKEPSEKFQPTSLLFTNIKKGEFQESLNRALIAAEAVNIARNLGDLPPNYLTPTVFAEKAETMSKQLKLSCKILGPKEMQREKMGLFLTVAQGSAEEPRLIVMEYKGAGAKGGMPVALVGKGLTFDAGGISLKPGLRMEEMKYDMMGAAAVMGIMHAVASLRLPVNVVALIGSTENMPGGKAQKPSDIQTSMSGKTVEIINTDAEGRLVLADVLEYAQKYYEPQAIIDFATLTGAVVDALGKVATAIMGNHNGLIARMKDSADFTGERVWELPLFDEYLDDMRSDFADIKNSGVREAGSSKGGIFLKYFVDSKFPWVHCDIAATAWNRRDVNYHPNKYGSGVMVRLITNLLENWKSF